LAAKEEGKSTNKNKLMMPPAAPMPLKQCTEDASEGTPLSNSFKKQKALKEKSDTLAKEHQDKQASEKIYGESVKVTPGTFVSITVDYHEKPVQGAGHALGWMCSKTKGNKSLSDSHYRFWDLGNDGYAWGKGSTIAEDNNTVLYDLVMTSPFLHEMAKQIKSKTFDQSHQHQLVSIIEAQQKY
jgi:hypothetical protein